MRGRRPFLTVAVTVAATLLTVLPAAATPAGIASAGSATIVDHGATVPVGPVAPCSLTGQQQNSSAGATKPGLVSYGPATSTCTLNGHASASTANGGNFALSALQAYGGPLIKVATYQVSCTATTNGTNASWSFGGLTGVLVPKQIPQNYTVPIRSGGTLLANVIFDEVVLPDPNDGSITLNMMHIVLFPDGGGSLSGDVYVGSTACSPTV